MSTFNSLTMGTDEIAVAADSSSSKQRRRRKGISSSPSQTVTFSDFIPGDIVCTNHDLKKNSTSTELALLLVLAVVGIYMYGFIESIQSLPDVSSGRHLGINMNLAVMEVPTTVTTTSTTTTSSSTDKQHRIGKNNENENKNDIPIPVGIWPVSVGQDEYESMIHVGDMKTVMQVPKFWSPPVHNNQLFTQEQAMQIGTCAEQDPVTGSSVRGTACPISQRTIYVGIASYRDYQCRETLESAFQRAEYPNRVRVGTLQLSLLLYFIITKRLARSLNCSHFRFHNSFIWNFVPVV